MITEEKPSLAELRHFGVKGMKWGRRKHYSTSDIKNARARLDVREKKYGEIEGDYTYGRKVTPQQEKVNRRIDKKIDKLDKEYRDDPDRFVAARMTRGEKAVTVILGGPFGLAGIAAKSASVRIGERKQQKRLAGQ